MVRKMYSQVDHNTKPAMVAGFIFGLLLVKEIMTLKLRC